MADYSSLPKKGTKVSCCCRCCFTLFMFLVAIGVLCASVIIWNAYISVPSPTPVIQTLDGPIQGNIKYSRDGHEYWEFLGIPYAMPIEGEKRFQPPVPIEPWESVKQVTSHPPRCAQFDGMITNVVMGEMDCLFLNVFSNVANGTSSKPVLVYIHGGAFMAGGAKQYWPDYFMDREIVLVVMNYRLGPYGFLNLQDESEGNAFAGNMGLKDQNLALKWVQKNIQSFGGDPESVTLFGESAGAVATHLHVLSPMSRGLIHRAIIQSGTAMAPWSFSKYPKNIAMEYAKTVGCPVEKKGALVECYKNTKWEDLVKYQYALIDPTQKKDMFEPTMDGTFLKENPQEIIKSGNFPAIPVMFGVNDGEGGIRTGRFDAMPELIPKLDENWEDLLENLMLLDEHLPADVAIKIREQYFGNMTFTEDVEGFKRNLTLLMSDTGFFLPVYKSALHHAKRGAPTYLYYFNYTSKIYPGFYSAFRATRLDDWLPSSLSLMWAISYDWVSEFVFGGRGSRAYGVSHAEDTFQQWNVEGVTGYIEGRDAKFSRSFIKALVDFANDTKSLRFGEHAWPSINDDLSSGKDEYAIPYMLMDDEDKSKVIPQPFSNRIKSWADLTNWGY